MSANFIRLLKSPLSLDTLSLIHESVCVHDLFNHATGIATLKQGKADKR